MKFENPFSKKQPVLDTNVRIDFIDKEKTIIELVPNYRGSDFLKIRATFVNRPNIELTVGDEFYFGAKVDYLGGHFFELVHVKTDKKIGFSNSIFL